MNGKQSANGAVPSHGNYPPACRSQPRTASAVTRFPPWAGAWKRH